MCTGLTVVFESMAMGKPIITTKNEFYSLDVEESGVGLNVDFNDKDGWINAINYMIENPELAASMGIKGKALCKEQYNYDLFCAELIQNIENIIIESTPKSLSRHFVS
jgi:glycosyltransferase involved in cell wall biosynthesis